LEKHSEAGNGDIGSGREDDNGSKEMKEDHRKFNPYLKK